MSREEEDAKRTIWTRRVAIVDGVVTAGERLSSPRQEAVLREIARRALWHMRNEAPEEPPGP